LSHLGLPLFLLSVVFGKVTEGMDVIKNIEAVGSGSGTTRTKVMVAASGQL
jgi:cyclophilin family peptidyl-prolyl cis-trans isomerase